jgi:hypothetical protein
MKIRQPCCSGTSPMKKNSQAKGLRTGVILNEYLTLVKDKPDTAICNIVLKKRVIFVGSKTKCRVQNIKGV